MKRFSATGRVSLVLFVLSLATGGCLRAGCQAQKPEPAKTDNTRKATEQSALEAARSFYQTRPYFQQPFEYTEVPEGLPDLEAETCGNCHEQIYEEWKVSTHRRAWTDPQFQAELKKSRGAHKDKKDDVGWMCVNCHTPLKNQLPRFVVGIKDGNIGKPTYRKNPHFSKDLKHEGITCASCHVRDGKVYGPYGDTEAPHPTAKDPDLRTEEVCVQCHQAEEHWPSRNLACFFNTGKQWKNSKYGEKNEYCQSCHMPKVKRRLVKGDHKPRRVTRRHWFGGSLIPKRPEYREQLDAIRDVYGSGAKIEVLDATSRAEMAEEQNRPGLSKSGPCGEQLAADCLFVPVQVTNAYAGHNLPTGDPERHIDIEAKALEKGGGEIAVSTQRIASKYKWWPKIELQYDNRLGPDESLTFRVGIPKSRLPATLKLKADKYRMYKSAFKHHDLKGRYVRGRKFHRSRWKVSPDGDVSLEVIEDDWGKRQRLLPKEKRNQERKD